MVAAGQSKGRQMVMMGDVCEMRDGSPSSTKIGDCLQVLWLRGWHLGLHAGAAAGKLAREKEKETWPLVSSTDKKTGSEP